LFKELCRLGYVEGQNLAVERYSGEGRTDRYADLAREVVRTQPDAIFLVSVRTARHFMTATTTIPIIAYVGDPVGYGLVTNLAHPGGNITGIAVDAGSEIQGKFLELLREAVPTASRIGYLTHHDTWDQPYGREARDAAQRLGVSLVLMGLKGPINEMEYRRVFTEVAGTGVGGLLVTTAPEIYSYRQLIVELSNKNRLPAIYPYRDCVDDGGLMAYATDIDEDYRVAARMIARVLGGENPGDLPFQQSSKFGLIINMKTAKALGIKMPSSLLARADEVVE